MSDPRNADQTVEPDEFQQLWRASEARLAASLRLNEQFFAQANLSKVERSLGTLSRGVTAELLVNVVAIVLVGSFAFDVRSEPRYLVPALLLGVYALAILNAGIRQIVAVRGIDFDEPVAAVSMYVERLRLQRSRSTQWTLLAAPFMWVPLLIVALRGFLGIDAYAVLGAPYLAVNAMFGLLLIPLALWIEARFGPRMRRSSLVRRLLDDLAGRSIARARESLDAIRRFEDNAPAA
jgi:hypothetical protein